MVCTECGTEFNPEENKLTGRGCGCKSPVSLYVCPKCGKKYNSDGSAYVPAEAETPDPEEVE